MIRRLIILLIISNSLFAKKHIAINYEWTGLFPSLNLEHKFENTKFEDYILRLGVGKYNYPKSYSCSDCGGPGYLITPSLSIYKEKDIEKFKDERGFTIVVNSKTCTIARVITFKYIPQNKNYYYRFGAGYGVLFSSTSSYIPIILPTFGFGMKF